MKKRFLTKNLYKDYSHKEEKFRELQALEWAENAHFGSEKRETEKNERSVF